MTWRIDEDPDPSDKRSRALNLNWDAENRLETIKRNGSTLETFTYDGDGTRIKAVRGTRTTFYVGDYYEYTEESFPSWHKVDLLKYYDGGGGRIGYRQGTSWPPSTLYWVLTDQVNSTSKTILASNRSVASEIRYKPWGDKRYEGGTTATKKRYTGQREEVGTGLYFYNARYYDPALARFVSPDSIVPNPGNPQDLNRFSYVGNNPIRYADPSGHCAAELAQGAGCLIDPRALAELASQVAKIGSAAAVGAVGVATAPITIASGIAASIVALAVAPLTLLDPPEAGANVASLPAYEAGEIRFTQPVGSQTMSVLLPLPSVEPDTGVILAGGEIPSEISEVQLTTAGYKRPDFQPLRGKEATDAAKALGYNKRIGRSQWNTEGQPAFFNGKNYISPDKYGHKGGVWKMFNKRHRRLGTFDAQLNRVGD